MTKKNQASSAISLNPIFGTDTDNQIIGTNSSDKIFGKAGNDIIAAKQGNDVVFGGAGNDNIFGGNGNDKLFGNAGQDHLWGGNGNDLLNGGPGSDTLDGGNGTDTALFVGVYDDFSLNYSENYIEVTDLMNNQVDTLKNIEIIQFDDQSIDVGMGEDNTAPVANDDVLYINSYIDPAAISLTVDIDFDQLNNLLDNDTDADGDMLAITEFDFSNLEIPIEFNFEGDISSVLGEKEVGNFEYTITDGNGGYDTAMVDVIVNVQLADDMTV